MDVVFIKALRMETVIGIYDWEKTMRQPVVIDLDMAWDNRPSALVDDIGLALDYEAVSKRVRQFVCEQSFLLVERLAEEVAALLLQEFNTPWVRVQVTKPTAIEGADGVGVLIERGVRS